MTMGASEARSLLRILQLPRDSAVPVLASLFALVEKACFAKPAQGAAAASGRIRQGMCPAACLPKQRLPKTT